jgi:selenide,water dikinase
MKDLAKRRRVMQRSIELGHCVCNPKKACPCDVFKEKDVCPCAGERLDEAAAGPVRLTQLVDSPGCASKIDEASLRRVLSGLPASDDPRVILGVPAGDDAGVYRIDGPEALVQTVDVFSPSVDDPYTFGQIAAANSLSDVYAMGGRPITALSIIGFPIRSVPDEVMREILRGGLDKMAEAGVPVIGGHSINDAQIKAGFAVTGLVRPERIVTHAAARPGDRLVLTKPVGTGIIAFAAQIGRASHEAVEAAADSMAQLNRCAAELMVEFQGSACTDVTGFGLMGHLAAMAEASRVDVEVIWDDVPLLPEVLRCAADGVIPGAVERNRESSGHAVVAGEVVAAAMLDVLFDAQTSGGLLIAVADDRADELVKRLRVEGCPTAAAIGRAVAEGTGKVFVKSEGRRPLPARRPSERAKRLAAAEADRAAACCEQQETSQMSCCEEGHPSPDDVGAPADATGIEAKFMEFMKAANAPGVLDGRTRRAMAIALSVATRCEPCVRSHIKKARDEGFSQEEIDEAGWLAVSFAGCPAMMFFKKFRHA